jgi:hypothetical protein
MFDADLDFKASRVRLWQPGTVAQFADAEGLVPVPAAVLNESGEQAGARDNVTACRDSGRQRSAAHAVPSPPAAVCRCVGHPLHEPQCCQLPALCGHRGLRR